MSICRATKQYEPFHAAGELCGLEHVVQLIFASRGRAPGNHVGVDILRQRYFAHVHLEDLFPAQHVREPDDHLTVEAART